MMGCAKGLEQAGAHLGQAAEGPYSSTLKQFEFEEVSILADVGYKDRGKLFGKARAAG